MLTLSVFAFRISGLRLETRQLLQKGQDSSNYFSGVFYEAKSLPKSHITGAVLSEFDEVLEVSDFDKMLNLFL
jgi:hypothetical protein